MTRAAVNAQINRTLRRMLAEISGSLLTIQDLAARYQCDVRTIRKRKANGTFPAPDVKVGNMVRWLPETISNFEKSKVKVPR